MSDQQLHNTPPDAGAINRAPTESEPALSHNTTLKVTSETENEIPTAKPVRGRSKKQLTRDIKSTDTQSADTADTPVKTPSEAPSIEPEKKSTPGTKRRPTKPRKKFIKEVEPEVSPFEPDLDATPVKPRDTERRASITVVAPEPAIGLEVDAPQTPLPPVEGRVGAGLAPALVTGDIPETPLPPGEGRVRAGLAPALITGDIPETPLPLVEEPRPGERRRVARTLLVLCLLVLFLTSSFLLWRDVNDTHLYLYHIDAPSGQVEAQQDLGGGYQDAATLTNPVLLQSSLLLGVSTSQSGSQQILTLAGSNTSWRVAAQHTAQLAHSTLSVTPNNLLVVEYAGGLQVMTAGGQMLWQTTGEEPTLGAHAFAPAFDHSTVYNVKNASKGIVAAYDLRNGAARWTQHLDDTLAYAPPLLLYGDTVFVAGDHTLYALNTATGVILWKAVSTTRTLLMAS